MTTRARRRLRRILEEDRAKCPFTVTALSAPFDDRQDRSTKKRKRVKLDDNREPLRQESLFAPKGKFKKHQSMDVAYEVEPRKGWLDMTCYNSFIYNGAKYRVDDYICVTNDATVKRQNAAATDSELRGPFRLTDYWVAKILEIRGLDPEHVYARVFWMYSPDELPPNTLLDGNYVSGRQSYHGQHELIASNHMDIINVVSIAMPASVNHWLESEDEGEQGALYWRQAFNCLTSEPSAVDLTCRCRSPENPDKTLVGCSNPQCEQWLHYECLLDAFLTRVYHNLGTEKPHCSEKYPTKAVSAASTSVSPDSSRSTTSNGAEKQAPIVCQEIKVDSPGSVEQAYGIASCSTGSLQQAPVLQESAEKDSELPSGRTGPFNDTRHAYEGLFKAELDLDSVPTVWKVQDLRSNVSGGDRIWTENVHCLVCGSMIP